MQITGKQLRALRLKADLTQAGLATRLGVSQPRISSWENVDSTLDLKPDIVAKIAALETSAASQPHQSTPDGVHAFGSWVRETRTAAGLTVPDLAEKSGVSIPQIYNIEAGRSTNPREQTRKKLETALDSKVPKAVTEVAAEDSSIEGLGPLTDFDPHDESDLPAVPGVYVFYDVSDRPVYVGKSKSIKGRVKSHFEKFWFKYPIVSHAAYVEVKDEVLRHQVEQVLIKFLKSNAVINKQSVDAD